MAGLVQSHIGPLQEALPLPALIAPALAAANQDEVYLRWKAVIHYLPNRTAAEKGPDFAAARWLQKHMAYTSGTKPVVDASGA